ncbi:nuclear transport factor 2 family protein [Streptacidiphilus cavernicola]|uniref:Nuclear transport factor 2 family protein n=1 Tax=Streptacidiphilus cavernicola TaxID=3342716 RepID=A0ABV6VNU8_9ACTN
MTTAPSNATPSPIAASPSAPASPTPTPLPAAPVRALLDAVRRGDATAFTDLFGATGTVDDWGRTFTGRAAIRGWSDREFLGLDARLTVRRITAAGTALVVDIATTGGYNGPAALAFTLTADGRHLDRMRMTDE